MDLTSSDNSTNDINTLSFNTKNWNKQYRKGYIHTKHDET